MLPYAAATNAGSTTFNGAISISGNLDYSGIKTLFVRQYEPASLGSVNAYVMGPELTLSNPSLTNGGLNTVSGSLNPTVAKSINLSVRLPHGFHCSLTLRQQPPPQQEAASSSPFNPLSPPTDPTYRLQIRPCRSSLIKAQANVASAFTSGSCPANLYPSLTTDVAAGTVQYNDPFPAAWRRTFRVCQGASVTISLSAGTQAFNLTNTQTTALPTATVQPLLSGVQNPKINGADLFTAGTVNSKAVTLSWNPPRLAHPSVIKCRS